MCHHPSKCNNKHWTMLDMSQQTPVLSGSTSPPQRLLSLQCSPQMLWQWHKTGFQLSWYIWQQDTYLTFHITRPSLTSITTYPSWVLYKFGFAPASGGGWVGLGPSLCWEVSALNKSSNGRGPFHIKPAHFRIRSASASRLGTLQMTSAYRAESHEQKATHNQIRVNLLS